MMGDDKLAPCLRHESQFPFSVTGVSLSLEDDHFLATDPMQQCSSIPGDCLKWDAVGPQAVTTAMAMTLTVMETPPSFHPPVSDVAMAMTLTVMETPPSFHPPASSRIWMSSICMRVMSLFFEGGGSPRCFGGFRGGMMSG